MIRVKAHIKKRRRTIEGRKFYDLCQYYRHLPITQQTDVVDAYKMLIRYIDRRLNA